MKHETLPATERLEAATIHALHEAASDDVRERLGLRLEEIGGTLVSIAERDPSIMLNRALGLGLTEPATPQTVAAIRDRYAQAGLERFFLQLHPDARPEGIGDMLRGAGLRAHRRWMKFKRDARAPPAPHTTLAVREIGVDHADEFGRIAASGFDLAPAGAGLFPGLVERDAVHLYMSFDGETPVGTGLLCIDGRDAWVDWGATDPAFRGRGSQRALLAQRIADAIEAGCTSLRTCTGEASPGDPQHSYHNIEWAGFRPDYLCGNWVPDRAVSCGWSG